MAEEDLRVSASFLSDKNIKYIYFFEDLFWIKFYDWDINNFYLLITSLCNKPHFFVRPQIQSAKVEKA